jgi:nitrile hydratase
MNGPHDMGGFTRFGPVTPERDEPVFHTEWERRLFALALASGAAGGWNIDISRHARERLAPRTYWSSSYYKIWLEGLLTLLTEHGLVSPEEIAEGRSLAPSKQAKRVLAATDVPAVLASGGPASRSCDRSHLFQVGSWVRARTINPEGHTRLPRYARGRVGEIVRIHGIHVFPDSSAHGKGEDPQWLYSVRFTARELWGHDTNDSVHLDLWEPYLDPL